MMSGPFDPARTELPRTLDEFRTWASCNDLPEKTRVDFYRGEVWVDLTQPQVFAHGLLNSRFVAVLAGLSHDNVPGFYFSSGVLVTNVAADVSGNPDGVFVSHAAIRSGRVTFPKDADGGCTEILGAVDMLLEVVSTASVHKDTIRFREAYWAAGIGEYWLADAREDRLTLTIFKRGSRGYTEVRRVGGWVKSTVFGRSFRLTRTDGPGGHPQYTLEHK